MDRVRYMTGVPTAAAFSSGRGGPVVVNRTTGKGYTLKSDNSVVGIGGEAFPVGSVFIAVVSTDPATLLGYGTWSAFGAGRVLVGLDSGDTDFDTAEETGGAKTKAISAHAGSAVGDHASHTHTYTQVPNHVHIIAAGQGSHQHDMPEAATDGDGAFMDKASGGADASPAVVTDLATLPQMTTNDPTGGVATGTTAGPSATLTHSVTQPSAHTDLNVVQPYIVVYMWKRTA
jgi:hypothetical protein